jgi:hypothetical protein
MKKMTLLCLSVLMTSIAFSQQNEEPEMLLTRDIGFNTTFLFQQVFNSGQTPFSVMLKSYSREGRATRYGINLGVDVNRDDNGGSSSNYYSNSSWVNVSLSIGKELQKQINSTRWVWFYGGDIIPFYRVDKREDFHDNVPYSTNDYQRIGIALRPFLGMRFNINKKLYVSAEASLNASYAFSKQLIKQSNPLTVVRDSEGSNIAFNLSPASGLFLYYRF